MSLTMVLLKGHPGTGKTTLARLVAQTLKWPLIDKDDARDCFSLIEDQVSASDLNKLSYTIMFRLVETQLSLNISVVVDCPFAYKHLYETAEQLAGKYSATIVVVECEARDSHVWQQRLERRAAQERGTAKAHKPADWAALQGMLARYDGCWRWSTDGSCSIPHHLLLDTTAPDSEPQQLTTRVLQFLLAEQLLTKSALEPGLIRS